MRRHLFYLAIALTGCSGNKFASDEGGTGGTAGSAGNGSGGAGTGGSTSGGSGGSANGGSNSSGGANSSGGSGGQVACSCPDGQYCRAGNCRNCSDLSSLQFGEPEALGVGANAGSTLGFARTGDGPTALFYSTDTIFRTDDPGVDGVAVFPDDGVIRRSPLYIENSGLAFNFVFTQYSNIETSKVVLASWNGSAFANITDAPFPINMDGGNHFSAAFVPGTTRFYWVSDRDGDPELLTHAIGDTTPVVMNVQIPAPNAVTCHAVADDYSPWVTVAGNLMLFSAQPKDEGCVAIDGAATDLYAVLLSPTQGTALGTAVPLSDVNQSAGNSSEMEPSLSPDLCTLYFTADGGSAGNSQRTLYRALRR